MQHLAALAIHSSSNPNFPAVSLNVAIDWQRAGHSWPASKACSFATLLAASIDGICDAAEHHPNFLEAAACELVLDAHLLMGGRKWHTDAILKAAAPASVRRLESACAAICDAFNSDITPSAVSSSVAIECISSIFLIARNVPQADISWPSVSACVISWCSVLLSTCQNEAAPPGTADACSRVLSLIAAAARAHTCSDLLTNPTCVQLVCICCEFQRHNDRLLHLAIELLDRILSFSAPSEATLGGCAVPVTGFGSKCSLVWQSSSPFGLSSVQTYSGMLVSFFISKLQPHAADGSASQLQIPQTIALNCLRCLNTLLWHDDTARHTALSSIDSLALALDACATCPQTTVRHAAAFVRCTVLLRCNVDFVDSDGLSSAVIHRHLLHVFPELLRIRSSSRPQSSSRSRPLSASTPPVVASADMIVFATLENNGHEAVHMHGLLHRSLSDVLQLPVLLSQSSELACAVLDTATVICLSSDCARIKLSECNVWTVLLQAIECRVPHVRVSATQLAATLRHNSACLAFMSCSSSLISALRRSIQHLSNEGRSNWDTKAAACACSLLQSIVASAPAVAGSLLYGRRFGRAAVPYESVDFTAACLQRVHREEDEASDNDDDVHNDASLGMSAQIFNVENELSDTKTLKDDQRSSPRRSSPPLPNETKRAPLIADSAGRSFSPSQRRKTLCVGTNGIRRQQRLMTGLEQGILSTNLSCRCSAVMLAAELAAVFVSDGLPTLATAAPLSFSPDNSFASVLSVSDASINFEQKHFAISAGIALILTDTRCIEAAATLLREVAPSMHLTACKFLSWSIKSGATMQMRTQLYISNALIHTMDAALHRVLDSQLNIDANAPPVDALPFPTPSSPSVMMTKIRSSETQSAILLPADAVTFLPLQVAAPADACVWPISSKQLTSVSVLEEVLRAFRQVLDASDSGVGSRFGESDWNLLVNNIRLLMQRGKYYDLPAFRHKNVQSDSTTAATLWLLSACVRAQCNHTKITEDSSFLEALFAIMNNPGAMGPNAALAAALELAKLPDTQRALSSTFGYMTGTKAGQSWKNSAMSKMAKEIKRLCFHGGSPQKVVSKSGTARIGSVAKLAHVEDEDEDEDFSAEEPFAASGSLLPPISSRGSSRVATSSPLSRVVTTSNGNRVVAASPTPAAVRSPARPPAPVRSTPNAPSSRGRTSQGCMSPAQAVLPALK